MCIKDSYTLAITGSTDIGLNCDGRLADGDFGTGVMLASFHSSGVWPLAMQWLISLVMLEEITGAAVLRRWAEISSAPVAFACSNFEGLTELLLPQMAGT